jgi:septum formation protein
MLSLPHLFLASKSPRRHRLLEDCGFAYTVIDVDVDETAYPREMPLTAVAEYLAVEKATAAAAHVMDGIVLAADSVVICDDHLLGKPVDRDDAARMLSLLSDRRHVVVTGVCILDPDRRISFSETTYVTFASLTAEEVAYYINHFAPYDKAGAYAVQEWIGHCKITRIEGSYTNIMGLPTERVYRTIVEMFNTN